jgi:Flp pilus assembly protein TadG
MTRLNLLLRDRKASAAAEMALVMPILLTLMFGSLELGNYFMNEHTLVKAVRNGARFAARQNFTNYPTCSGSVGEPALTNTKNTVMRGYMAGGTIITPNIQASDISVNTSCKGTAGGQSMNGGLYFSRPNGAQIVTVSASVNYRPVVGLFGFSGIGMRLNASSEAAVAGI